MTTTESDELNDSKTNNQSLALGRREKILTKVIIVLAGMSLALVYLARPGNAQRANPQNAFDRQISENSQRMFEEGKQIFRYDTFGDEAYWTDKLKLHNAIQGSKFGGVGPGVSPKRRWRSA